MWAGNIVRNCMNVSPGEQVLICVDEPLVFVRDRLSKEVLEAGASGIWTYTIPDAVRPLEAYPPSLHELIIRADVVISLQKNYYSLQESSPRLELAKSWRKGRARWGSGMYIDEDILGNELTADYQEIAALTERLAQKVEGKDRVHLTSAVGTDLTLSIAGRKVRRDTGLIHTAATFGNLPGGEVYMAPLEDSAEGVLVVDKSFPGIVIRTPVRIVFERGRAISIEGEEEAEELRKRIEDAKGREHGEWAEVIGELGIGTNPQARLLGNIMTDEKVKGTVHVALGNNYDHPIGGINRAPIHIDLVMGEPTLVVDGDVLIEKGRYLV